MLISFPFSFTLWLSGGMCGCLLQASPDAVTVKHYKRIQFEQHVEPHEPDGRRVDDVLGSSAADFQPSTDPLTLRREGRCAVPGLRGE
jgi:hypothetical protein